MKSAHERILDRIEYAGIISGRLQEINALLDFLKPTKYDTVESVDYDSILAFAEERLNKVNEENK